MGRLRGKRNRDQDRYWHERRKATQSGMVAAADVECCVKCARPSPVDDLVHGWCQSCMTSWRASADPVMLAQAASGYAPQKCLKAPSETDVSRILNAIVARKDDKEFLPLLLFRGPGTVGRMQSLWNFSKTMELLELKTTADVLRLSQASHDLVHRCGLHAPVQRSTLDGFFSRVLFAENFKPLQRDQHLRDYIRWFANANRMWLSPRGRITAIAEWKSTRPWRVFPRIKHKPLTEHWPFLHKEAAKDHLDIMLVDSLVPKGIPEQWRQDMCQDLFVAVLSGELSQEDLRRDARYYIERVWRRHPYKYGALSIHAPIRREDGGKTTILDVLADRSLEDVDHIDHLYEERPQPSGIGTLGDLLRDKNNGMAIPDLHMEHPDLMDEEIFEVYRSEVKR